MMPSTKLLGLWLAVWLAGGCLQTTTKRCGDRVCPSSMLCHEETGLCVTPAQLEACDGKAEEEPCTYAGSTGSCFQGVCEPHGCGNGLLEIGEKCDDGNTNSGDGCSSDCRSDETCGNGIVDVATGEACDDGNDVPMDGCQPSCALPSCGDGILDSAEGEMCDDGNTANGDGCNARCTSNETCGNSIVDAAAAVPEGCDQGAGNSDAANAACRTNCQPQRCGDGVIDAARGEQCEGTDVANQTCTSVFGYYDGTLTCSSTCRFSVASCGTHCGDGIVQAAKEECEPSVAITGKTCANYGFHSSDALACTTACRIDTSGCSGGRCGDNILQAGEQCDGTKLGGKDCTDLGFDTTDTLGCNLSCTFDTSKCTGGYCGDHLTSGPEYCDGRIPNDTCIDVGQDMGRLGCTTYCAPAVYDDCARRELVTQVTGTTSAIKDVFVAGNNDIYAVGAGGTILHYDVSGWSLQTSGTTQQLNGVWGSSASDIYAVGASGTVLHSTGNGTWTPVSIPTSSDLAGIHGTGPSDIWIVGPAPVVLRYTGTWNVITGYTGGASFNDVYTPVAGTAFLVGDGATIRKYASGTWSSPAPGGDSAFVRIWGRSASDIYVAGRYYGGASTSTIQHFDGISWSVDGSFGTSMTVYDVTGTSTETYAAVYDGGAPVMKILRRGPATWDQVAQNAVGANYIYALAITPTGEVIASGTLGVERLDVWSRNVGTPSASVTWSEVWAASESDAFYVGSGGNIWRRTGTTFAAMTSNTTNTLNAVWGASASRVFAVGASGTIRLWDGVGPGWITMTTNPSTTTSFNDVWGSGPNDVFAVGGNGVSGGMIYHYDGNASNIWTAMSPVGGNSISGVGGSGPNDVYAGGFGSITNHYDGSTWSSISLPGMGADVIVSRRPGEALLFDGSVLARTEDYGVTWQYMNSTTTGPIRDAAAVGPRGDIYAVGDNGLLLHFDDERWTTIRPVSPGLASAGISVVGNHVFVVGNNVTGSLGYELHHTKGTRERCGNEWDDDADGLHDCADPDCIGDPYCTAGGACQVAGPIACGAVVMGASFTGSPFPDDYACVAAGEETGPEVSYRFVAAASGSATVTVSGYSADLDLFVLKDQATGGCDPIGCIGSSVTNNASESVTFTATAGQAYQFVVDGSGGAASDFTMSLSCP